MSKPKINPTEWYCILCGADAPAKCTCRGEPPPTLDHRWSGWPGAWCLDCGVEDANERCLAEMHPEGCTDCENTPCPEPGSNRHNPYVMGRKP